MDYKKQKKAAKEFADQWKGKGYEKGEAQVFWTELLRNVFDVKYASSLINFEEHTSGGGFIDGFIRDPGIIIEQKGSNIDLDKPETRQGTEVTPFEQALRYAESFKQSQQPRFIITCNFGIFRVYDRDAHSRNDLASNYNEFTLEEFGENPSLLSFITNPENSRSAKEKKASVAAAQNVSKLYQGLYEKFIDPDSPESQHALNVLCVRIVFCLFCEDAGLFPKDAFLEYLRCVEPKDMRVALKRLFVALDTPINDRDPYDEDLKPFPYVNGGLFQGEVEIPNFDNDLKYLLLKEVSQDIDWSGISPTIFGAMFESTLNPETRHDGGMHYTSIENIHKVIDPLFLDELRGEFEAICNDPALTERKKLNRLRKLHKRICSMNFFDPACGSGNFLTETYISLRKLEDDILLRLSGGQVMVVWDLGDEDEADNTNSRVSLSQLYGIEVNDFAVRVAKTALWIAQLQANNESESLLDMSIDDFPLSDSANIVDANALRFEWNDLLPANECSFIMGNPPFLGHQWRNSCQQEDMDIAFDGYSRYGKLDYVCAWYAKAVEYMNGFNIHAAFVSTNSTCQGESVRIMWEQLNERGTTIDFAWPTFVWSNEAADQAHVHVVIVGFSNQGATKSQKQIYYSDESKEVSNINGYLVDAPNIYIEGRGKPLNPGAPEMTKGSQPTDGGHLILAKDEAEALLANHPEMKDVVRRYMGGREFINNIERYCLWFDGVDLSKYNFPEVRERLAAVRDSRLSSPTKSVVEAASTPALFTQIRQPKTSYLAIPEVSSSRRKYIPVGFIDSSVIASNKLRFIPSDDMYLFGLLASQAQMAWMRIVSGRLKSDYSYSPAVWNSFIFPRATSEQEREIREASNHVLEARELYADASLADLYDPDNEFFYPELYKAHKALDAAVEAAYGVDFHGDEEKMVAHLFKLYTKAQKCD
ncbi:DNA methyltransferase [Adlercreutzia equolifaciens]|uniref:DNA methyltransferase n=1 Tax=Adlercreutzia equolifaciens TaxID=446660 RepID=UPI0039F6278C